MARSPLTLAAAATAAVPGVEIVDATALGADGAGRNDAALVTTSDGRRLAVRLPREDAVDAELATEALALRALSEGVRALLDFSIPEFLGAAPLGDGRVFVTTFIPGYLVDAEHIPAGRGVAHALGRTIAAIHALPTSVVRSAGLPARTAAEVRADARRVMDEASATGRVPVRLMVRWREVIDDDALWQFEPTVTLGGADTTGFVYTDRGGEPVMQGVIDWHGLQVGDPAVDLQFLGRATEGAASVLDAYAAASHRAPDEMLRVRARLHSELEFAKWLLHGRDTHRDEVMDDAAALLDSLADGVRDDVLRTPSAGADLAGAMAALDSVPQRPASGVDTSMQTDTYDPEDLAFIAAAVRSGDGETQRALDGDFFADDPAATQALDPHYFDEATPRDAGATQPIDPSLFAEADAAAREAARATDPNATQPVDPGFFAEEDASARARAELAGTDAGDADDQAAADIAEAERAAADALRRWSNET